MSLARSAGKISSLTFLSRIFGLVRDQLFAALLGAGFYTDAFNIAFRIPNLLRDLFAEGALSNAFVPTFTDTRTKQSESEALKLVRLMFGWVLLVVGSITVCGIVFAPEVVSLIASGFEDVPGKMELTTYLTRIMFPFLLLVSLASILMGVHNSYGKYALPAFAPVLFNWVSIGAGILMYLLEWDLRSAVIGWSVGTLLAGFAQFAVQLIPFAKQRIWLWPSFSGLANNSQIHRIFYLMVPSIIALSGTQINILVNSRIASLLEEGAVTWLNFSFRLMQLPIGVFGVAISVVALSQASSFASSNNMEKFHANTKNSVRLSYLLTIPSAVGLWIMAVPIIEMIFEHGRFTHQDTLKTAEALMYYSIGLPFYASVKVKAPIFFTIQSSKVPMMASLAGVTFNIVFNILVYRSLGHKGLALGTSLGVMLNSAILSAFYMMKTKVKPDREGIITRLKVCIAAGLMGWFTMYLNRYLPSQFGFGPVTKYLLPIFIVAAASITYLVALWILKVHEVKTLVASIRKLGIFAKRSR